MSLRTFGPYVVDAEIGRGGGGVVYRARGDDGVPVAVKTLPAHDEDALAALRREIHALARIRHPGVVRILGDGQEGGVPWLAMELIDGPTFGDRCRQIWDPAAPPGDPARLAQLLALFRRLCTPLAFLHGEGIVHRDLKPRNVLVRAGDLPVVVDFGLVVGAPAPGREPLLVGGHAGTAAFMAPEQIRGEAVDPRADLFALGSMLCLALTGSPPFATLADVVDDAVDPLLPSSRAPSLPAELDRLVARLLAREPRRRLGHADDVAAALARLGAANGFPGPAARAYVYRPSFVGRTALRQALATHVRAAARGRERLLLVGGESGIGKTRLCAEVARDARGRGVRVVASECALPQSSLGALRPLLQTIADACRTAGDAEAERLLGDDGPVLALHEPSLAALPSVRARPAPTELAPADAARRLHRALDAVLARVVEKPTLLVLDDLQWADELSLAYLEHVRATGLLDRLPLAVLGNFRSESAPDALARLARAPGVGHLSLTSLEDGDVGTLVGDMLAVDAPWGGLVRFVARRSSGNPFFVGEYLRAAIGAGLLSRDGAGHWAVAGAGDAEREETFEALGLPTGLRDLVAARIDALSGDARALLDAAAILGRESEEAVAVAVSGLAERAALDAIVELQARHVLEPAPLRRLRIVHDQLREVAAAALAAEQRIQLHAGAAREIEARHGDEGEHQASLALHWEQAGEVARALPRHRAAARHALSCYLHRDARRHLEGFLALVPAPDPERVKVLLELGTQVHIRVGQPSEALACMTAAREEAETLADPALRSAAHMGVSRALWRAGRLAEGLAEGEEALRLADPEGDRRHYGDVLGNIAVILDYQGDQARARELYEKAIEIHRSMGDLPMLAPMLMNLGCSLRDSGLLEEAAARLEEARRMHELGGQRALAAASASNLALVRRDQGRFDEARALLEACVRVQRETGQRRDEGRSSDFLGTVLTDLGRLDEARAVLEEALAIERETGDRHFEGVTLGNLASVDKGQGRIPECRARFRESATILLEVGDRIYALNALCNLAEVARTTGDLEGAAALLEEGRGLLEAVTAPFLRIRWLCEMGHLAVARGQDAAPFLAEASAKVVESGAGEESDLGRAVRGLQAAVDARR